jgi:hypothetical protein
MKLTWLFSLCVAFPIGCLAQYGAPPPAYFVIRGVAKTCDSVGRLDQALSASDPNYFAGWTAHDYDTAAAWALACVSNGYGFVGQGRAARLRAYQSSISQSPPPPPPPPPSAEQLAREAAEQEQIRQATARFNAREEAAQLAKERAAKQQEEQRQARIVAAAKCRHSDQHRLFLAQERVLSDQEFKAQLTASMDKQRKIHEISGVQNMALDYQLATGMVNADETLQKDWQTYATLGGTAESGMAVTRSLSDPCATKSASREE